MIPSENCFLLWLRLHHPEIRERYVLTNIKINGKLHIWMSPTVQEYWEIYLSIPDKPSQVVKRYKILKEY